jgi:hypothetical protein
MDKRTKKPFVFRILFENAKNERFANKSVYGV